MVSGFKRSVAICAAGTALIALASCGAPGAKFSYKSARAPEASGKEYFPEDKYGVKASPRITEKRSRLKRGGGEGGHNGLRSIANALGTRDFQRVRIGIGRPPGRKDPAAFVLEPFTAAERTEVPTLCELSADATELLIQVGLEQAQNQVHAW